MRRERSHHAAQKRVGRMAAIFLLLAYWRDFLFRQSPCGAKVIRSDLLRLLKQPGLSHQLARSCVRLSGNSIPGFLKLPGLVS